jgi:hypothetical protein
MPVIRSKEEAKKEIREAINNCVEHHDGRLVRGSLDVDIDTIIDSIDTADEDVALEKALDEVAEHLRGMKNGVRNTERSCGWEDALSSALTRIHEIKRQGLVCEVGLSDGEERLLRLEEESRDHTGLQQSIIRQNNILLKRTREQGGRIAKLEAGIANASKAENQRVEKGHGETGGRGRLMATAHRLKTWPEYFQAVASDEKNFEVRQNDRNFKVGDIVVLEEYDPEKKEYTGRQELRVITYILVGGQHGVDADTCVMSIERPDKEKR